MDPAIERATVVDPLLPDQPETMISLENIERRVAAHTPQTYPLGPYTRQAAVAAILRERNGATEGLFILRATREGDPWSGQMAFPGGHKDEEDDSLMATAIRETQEEIGIDLVRDARHIGALDAVRANPRGRNIDMIVTPHVFFLTGPVMPELNHEVADVLWGSLQDMHSGASHTRAEFTIQGNVSSFPGFAVGDQVVWGLTLRMLELFFTLLDPDWIPHEDW